MKKIIYFILGLLTILTIGCTSPKEIIKEVPVEVVKTKYETQYLHDSVYLHDSIIINVSGDTVVKELWKTKYVYKAIHDTINTHDSVEVPITVTETKIVEKKVPQWWPVYLCVAIVTALLFINSKFFKHEKRD